MRKGGANDANLISPGAPMRPHAPHTCCRARPGWWQDIPPGICAIQPVICIPGGSATLSPAVEANPKMAIGIILERDDLFFCPGQPCPPDIPVRGIQGSATPQCTQYSIGPQSPVNPARHISSAGVQGAAAPCMHCIKTLLWVHYRSLPSPPGTGTASYRCCEPQNGDRE